MPSAANLMSKANGLSSQKQIRSSWLAMRNMWLSGQK